MDSYETALRKLRADRRTLAELEAATGIPAETLRDIRKRICKNPRYETVKKLAKYYEPSA
jgi:transcriptional regulator with XRE-family HTH domain